MELHSLRIPKQIRKGDTLGIVAPSMPVKEQERGAIKEFLEKAGYRVKLGRTVSELRNFHNYLAGDAKTRAEDVNKMFADPEVDGIICARGGYGSSQVMPYLDLDMIRENPKVFVGYSDITNFHSVFNKYCNFVTYHGPMVISNMLKGFDDYSASSMEAALHMETAYEFVNPEEDPMMTVVSGSAKGIMTGGNLTLLSRSVGTFYEPDTAGKILLIEDIEESVPSMDMAITHLEQAGMMKNIAGLLVGNFSDCSNDRYDSSYTIEKFVRERFADYTVPVIANVCSAHKRPMGTIPMGMVCTMDADARTVTFTKE